MKFVLLVLLCCSWKAVSALRCFQCYMVEKPYYLQDGLSFLTCKDFDYSEKFIVECPRSTFCYKKTAKTFFYGQEYIREARGCAPQEYVGQKYDSFIGFTEERYVDPGAYKHECVDIKSSGLRSTDIVDCFCNTGDLCNSSNQRRGGSILLCLSVFVVFWN